MFSYTGWIGVNTNQQILSITPQYTLKRFSFHVCGLCFYSNGFWGTAICSLSLSSINDVFDNGSFNAQQTFGAGWHQVPDYEVPYPRPGQVGCSGVTSVTSSQRTWNGDNYNTLEWQRRPQIWAELKTCELFQYQVIARRQISMKGDQPNNKQCT